MIGFLNVSREEIELFIIELSAWLQSKTYWGVGVEYSIRRDDTIVYFFYKDNQQHAICETLGELIRYCVAFIESYKPDDLD